LRNDCVGRCAWLFREPERSLVETPDEVASHEGDAAIFRLNWTRSPGSDWRSQRPRSALASLEKHPAGIGGVAGMKLDANEAIGLLLR
jgi:hypothetical protein